MKKQCPSCFKITHKILDCPLINILPTYETVSLKWLFNSKQQRASFNRRKKKKHLYLAKFKKQFSKIRQEEITFLKSLIFCIIIKISNF